MNAALVQKHGLLVRCGAGGHVPRVSSGSGAVPLPGASKPRKLLLQYLPMSLAELVVRACEVRGPLLVRHADDGHVNGTSTTHLVVL